MIINTAGNMFRFQWTVCRPVLNIQTWCTQWVHSLRDPILFTNHFYFKIQGKNLLADISFEIYVKTLVITQRDGSYQNYRCTLKCFTSAHPQNKQYSFILSNQIFMHLQVHAVDTYFHSCMFRHSWGVPSSGKPYVNARSASKLVQCTKRSRLSASVKARRHFIKCWNVRSTILLRSG